MLNNKKTIGIIGFGNMGSAIAEGIKFHFTVYVFDKDKNKTSNLSGIKSAENTKDLLNNVDTVILAVKPQDFSAILNEIKDYIKDKLMISIAAGVETSYIEKHLGQVRVVRAMPNLPVKIRKGISCLFKGKYASDADANFAKEIFEYVGETLDLDKEEKMHVVTAAAGSGPGFFCSLVEGKSEKEINDFGKDIFMPKLEKVIKGKGFSEYESHLLASTTTAGTLALINFSAASNISLQALCEQVASPGGTTEAGLKELQKNIENLAKAIDAAEKKSEELSKKE